MQDMQVSELVARMRIRVDEMRTTAEEYAIEAKFHSDKALDLRLGAMEIEQRITFITEFVDGEPDETPADSRPGSEAISAEADMALAGEASPSASPAPVLDQVVEFTIPDGALTTSDASNSGSDSGLDAVLITTSSAEAPMDEAGTASSSETIPVFSGGTWVPDHQAVVQADNEEQDLVEVLAHEKAPDPAPAGGAATSPATTTKERVKALHAEHPEYTARQAWEALGLTKGSLSGHSYALEIRWAPAPPVPRFERPAPPAPSEDAIAPDETVTDFVQQRPRTHSKATQFRLRAGRGEGKYLHMSGVGMTSVKAYAWIGTEAHLLKLRQKFPDAVDLVEEPVEKEPAR